MLTHNEPNTTAADDRICDFNLDFDRNQGERSGSVVECLTWDQGAAGSSLTGVTVLWSLSKTYLS